ncbi:hypothetical protein VNO77_00584 [Canavalia gladiata]|uniref:Stress-response A/B barrel domain-containing protein n=1 Tax=Canavalia gladiata TaxID=3824 RepID=A0AAN9MRF0_CANGL
MFIFCDIPGTTFISFLSLLSGKHNQRQKATEKWVLQCNAQAMALVFLFVFLIDSPKPLYLFKVTYHWNRLKNARKNQRMMVLCGVDHRSSNLGSERKRKVVEHVCLIKAKRNLSEEEENDMLDYLYTTQYQMGGVVAISLGRVSAPNSERYTHALFMRFQKKDNLEKFYENPFYLKVLKDRVMTYCHVCTNMD